MSEHLTLIHEVEIKFIFHSDLFYNLQPCFILFLNFILNLKFFPTHVEGSISL
jgi:hypothetical protein